MADCIGEPIFQCRQCKQTSTIYGDLHGKFCRECGPSFPVDRVHLDNELRVVTKQEPRP